jgi:hypothetical protein
MKQAILFLVLLFASNFSFAQKSGKLKGSKVVTIEEQATPVFTSVLIQDEIQVWFVKADSTAIVIEADDNLHEALNIANNSGKLTISLNNKLRAFKKFEVKIYYTNILKNIEATDEAKLMILDEMGLEDISFKLTDKAKLFLNLKAKSANFEFNNNTTAEINANAEKIHFVMTDDASVKGLIAATELKVDQYRKSKATLEGDVIDLKVRIDNNAQFTGKNLTAKNAEILVEGYSETSLFAEINCVITAFANAEIELFGEPIIEIKKFTGKAVLKKNTLK